MLKRTFIVSIFVLFVTLVFWGVYNFVFNQKKNTGTSASPTETSANSNQKKDTSQISVISDEAVIAPVISGNGNGINYYSKFTGKAYQIDFDGQSKKIISDKNLAGLGDVLWSPDKLKAVHVFPKSDGSAQFGYYDYSTETDIMLNQNIDQVSWQMTGNKIFYKYYDPQKKLATINVSSPDGKDWQKLAEINYRYTSIAQIPKSGLVSFWNRPDGFNATSFESAPVISGNKRTILSGKYGADYLWAPDGTMALVSLVADKGSSKMQTATVNFNGGEYKNLELPTMVSKCVWSKDARTIYCALPGGVPDTAVLPNDYRDNKFTTTDTFWKMDVISGEKNRIIDLDKIGGKYDATNLFLNADESLLFFINKIDGKLYKMNF